MKEVEAKILRVNRKNIEVTLTSLGAKRIFDDDIQTFFFDFKDGSIVKAKNVLRLREDQVKSELTFKKVHATLTAKIADEYSVVVSSSKAMKKILENIGLSVIEKMQKHRISYTLDRVRFDIDRYYGIYGYIPEFLEIEAENIDLIHNYARLLGFKAKDCLPWSTNELISHYSSQKGKSEGE